MNSKAERKKVLILSYDKELTPFLIDLINKENDIFVSETYHFPFRRDNRVMVMPNLILTVLDKLEKETIPRIKKICGYFSHTSVLVVSKRANYTLVEKVLEVRARGVVFEKDLDKTLAHAIRIVLRGGIFLDESVRTHILSHIMSFNSSKNMSRINELSDRELEVYGLIKTGCNNHDISVKLYLSDEAVIQYRHKIKEKLQIDSFRDIQ